MALYKVTEKRDAANGEPVPAVVRLVEAKSDSAALKHVVNPRFEVEIVSNVLDAADLVGSGIAVERIGATPALAAPDAGKPGDGDEA